MAAIESLNIPASLQDMWPYLIAVLLACVEVSPIKINPIRWLLSKIGDGLNGDIKDQIKELRHDVDENEMDAIRWEVLNFANSCRHGCRHSKDEFEHVIRQNAKYHQLLNRTNRENGVFDLEYKYIREIYERRLRDNDFLI